MQFSANVGLLKKLLNPVIEVARNGVIKDCESAFKITLESRDNELLGKAYGGRLALSVEISDRDDPNLDYRCKEEGSVTVNATDLFNVLESFYPTQNVIALIDGKEFKICDIEDKDEFQCLPVFPESIELPEVADEFEKQISINRTVFLEGINKVMFAIGFRKTQPHYLNYVIRTSDDKVRFCAGTGGRFAVYDVSGKSVNESGVEFFIPKEQAPVILSVLEGLDGTEAENVDIKQGDNDGRPQMVFSSGSVNLILVGIDTEIKYPNVEKFLKAKKGYKVRTLARDWECVTKGLMATFNEEIKKQHEGHESDMDLDLDKKRLVFKSDNNMKASRKVPLLDVIEQEEEDIKFRCSTQYIKEIFVCSRKEDKITVEFMGNNKPCFAKWEEESNEALGTKSNFTMFFTALSRSGG